ncbi:MAG: anaerobic ribonucleoside-triphosphate reductase activating protein [Lachnospiraceae bacterium]|nr:anaerobic ribonucleoside-triphosphate reductase activating protein [Lachnospiraceae bacterium]
MQIHGFAKLTLLDYPGRIAATVFTGGCNFRCPFCHNAVLVLDPNAQPLIPEDEVLRELESRKNKLEGVCITGGEPTLNRDLPEFIEKVRALGLLVKLDSNGTAPDMIADLIDRGLIDYIAMDIKSSPEGYSKAVGLKDLSMDNIFRSVDLIMQSGIDYEFRTTVVDGIHTADDFKKTGIWIKGAKAYYLQQYKDSGDLIAPRGLASPSKETLEKYREILLPYVPNTSIRGTD